MHVQTLLPLLVIYFLINLTSGGLTRRYSDHYQKQNTVCSYTGLHSRCYDPDQISNHEAPHVKKHYRNARLNRLKNNKSSRVHHPDNPINNSHKKHGRNEQMQPSIFNEQPHTSKLIPDFPFLFNDYEQWFGNYDELYFANRYPED